MYFCHPPCDCPSQEYEGDQFLLIRGPENEFEYNYLWCSTLDSYEDHLQEMNERASGANLDKDRDVGGFDDDDGDDDDEGEGRSKRGKRGGFDKGDDGLEKAAVKRPVEAMTDIEIATLQVKTHRPPVGKHMHTHAHTRARIRMCLQQHHQRPRTRALCHLTQCPPCFHPVALPSDPSSVSTSLNLVSNSVNPSISTTLILRKNLPNIATRKYHATMMRGSCSRWASKLPR